MPSFLAFGKGSGMAKRKTRKVTTMSRRRSARAARLESLPPVSTMEVLSHPELLVLFATAPTGLGHLRVTQALRGGLPPAATPVLLGANDRVSDSLHRAASLIPLARTAFEWVQHGKQQDAVTAAYRGYLKLTAPMYLSKICEDRRSAARSPEGRSSRWRRTSGWRTSSRH